MFVVLESHGKWKSHTCRREQDEPQGRGLLHDRGLGSEASLETRAHASCSWGTFWRSSEYLIHGGICIICHAVWQRQRCHGDATCARLRLRVGTQKYQCMCFYKFTNILQTTWSMSSQGKEPQVAMDKGDRHWSGVGKGENFTATFASTDIVGSKSTLQFGWHGTPNQMDLCISIFMYGRAQRICRCACPHAHTYLNKYK